MYSKLKIKNILILLSMVFGVSAGPVVGDAIDNITPVTDEMLRNPSDNDWLMWRRTYDGWGYSPLDQINKDNVDDLRLAWAWTMEPGLQETTPLVRNGIMFLIQY